MCTHNAGRSQMAAGWLGDIAGDRVDVYSAGSEPADSISPVAVSVMAEKGIDIAAGSPRLWTDAMVRRADVVVTMGCSDVCPIYPGKTYVDWELQDPHRQPVELVRQIRDEIEQRVRALIDELGA